MRKSKSPKYLSPFQDFIQTESLSGLLLIIATLSALLVANTPLQTYYDHLLNSKLSIQIPGLILDKTLLVWVNDGLMTIFFLLVALEIKREFYFGELSGLKQALFPVFSAMGGALFPFIIFLVLNYGTIYSSGWSIPMATDIAFAIGILTVLGHYVPSWAKVFLTALAVIDDLFTIIIIGIFYTSHLKLIPVLIGALCVFVLVLFNVSRLMKLRYYIFVGVILWLSVLKSGIHATIAGVIIGFLIPLYQRTPISEIYLEIRSILQISFSGEKQIHYKKLQPEQRETILNTISEIVKESESPLHRLEHALNPLVAFIIMPIFAFFNAGISLSANSLSEAFQSTLTWGIILGLFFGNQIGIFGFSWILIKLGKTDLPSNKYTFFVLYGLSCLGGIGFTMSLFKSSLAFTDSHMLELSKIGILAASVLSGLAGMLILRLSYRLR